MDGAPARIGIAGGWHGTESGNRAILDIAGLRRPRFHGRPFSNALRSLISS
jgi:hypothetical protein